MDLQTSTVTAMVIATCTSLVTIGCAAPGAELASPGLPAQRTVTWERPCPREGARVTIPLDAGRHSGGGRANPEGRS